MKWEEDFCEKFFLFLVIHNPAEEKMEKQVKIH